MKIALVLEDDRGATTIVECVHLEDGNVWHLDLLKANSAIGSLTEPQRHAAALLCGTMVMERLPIPTGDTPLMAAILAYHHELRDEFARRTTNRVSVAGQSQIGVTRQQFPDKAAE